VPDFSAPIVCLVDDDLSVRRSVTHLLEAGGYNVRSFADGGSFLDHLRQNVVDVVILDIWMEKMTGIEVLAHLCAISPKTRIIFITGNEDAAAETTVMQAGVFAYFLKPFNASCFLNTVRRAVEKTGQVAEQI
jgi:FixJ family two-component response regulator